MKRILIFAVVLWVFSNFIYSDYKEEITKYFDGRKIEKISIENVNGGIDLERWEKPEIYIFAKKTSSSKAILEKTEVLFEEQRGELKIKVKKTGGWKFLGGSIANVEFIIKTPSPKDLVVSTVNGSVKVSNMEGFLSVSSVNGNLTVLNHKGSIESETVNGNINLSKIYGSLKGETVNGTIIANLAQTEENVELSTVNGSVTLEIEDLDNAEVRAETVNGAINIEEFQKPMKRLSLKRRSVYFIIGNGRKKVDIETVNGSIKISSSGKEI